jgi:eukaryotic-like serine/threonine-protein kinase
MARSAPRFVAALCLTVLLPALSRAAPSEASWPVFRGTQELTGATDARLPRKPRLLWSRDVGGAVKSTPVVAGDAVYASTMAGKLVALALADGKLRWSFDAKSPLEASPLYRDGVLYVGSSDGDLYAVEAARGRIRWRYKAGDRIAGAANFAENPGGAVVLVGSYDGALQAVDARTGVLRWIYRTSNFVNGTPAVTADGRVVFGGCDGLVHVLRAADGVEVAQIDTGSYIACSPALSGSRAYVANYAGSLLAVDLAAARILWTLSSADGQAFYSSPAVGKGSVLAGARDGRLHCASADTGAELWSFRTGGDVDTSPVVAGGEAVFASTDGVLYAVDLASGNELWSFEVGAAVGCAVAVIEGRVIFGAEDGRVYVVGD